MCPVNSIQLSVSEGKNLTWVSSEFLGTMYMCRDPPLGPREIALKFPPLFFCLLAANTGCLKKLATEKDGTLKAFLAFCKAEEWRRVLPETRSTC